MCSRSKVLGLASCKRYMRVAVVARACAAEEFCCVSSICSWPVRERQLSPSRIRLSGYLLSTLM
jgi:hypothetical protein